jgi:fumarate reductase subunit D
MAKSNKPLVWGPFAAGGTVAAFAIPALIVLTLLVALGRTPDGLSYASVHAFAAHWLGKTSLFVVVSLSLWGAMHRLRITCHDFGLRADGLVAAVVYFVASAGTVAAALVLLRIQ